MRYSEDRIVQAFDSNNIEKILVIDDAYDPPPIDENSAGHLVDFLDSESGQAACAHCAIDRATVSAARVSLDEEELDNDHLQLVYSRLFKEFIATDDARFDPSGVFRLHKEPALGVLRPLLALLGRCGEVRTSGLEDAIPVYSCFHPHVVFLDYYLGADFSGSQTVDERTLQSSRRASVDLLGQIVDARNENGVPAVVLVSSEDVDDLERYRHDSGREILALRFERMKKGMVQWDGESFKIEPSAADALLDMSESYLFGRELQRSLSKWKTGAELAFSDFMKQIGSLHTKDFAYLFRFRTT